MKKKKQRPVVDIDEANLHEEWIRQPALFHRWARRLALNKTRVSTLKAALDMTKAECSLQLRKDPGRMGLPRATDAAVEAAVLLHPKYREAMRRLIKARERMDLCQAVVDACEHRKKSLENLVTLFGMDYFSRPTAKTSTAVREKIHRAETDRVFGRARRLARGKGGKGG